MNIKRLRYFCTVVECGSITRAAQVLHLSQPPLSKRLQELEKETGTPLLERSANRVRPTAAGWFFYERALEILRNIDMLERETLLFSQEKQLLQVGLSYLFRHYFTPLILALQKIYPPLRVLVSDSSHLEHLLENRMIDFALIQKPQRLQHYDGTPCTPVPMVAVIHRQLLADQVPDTLPFAQLGHFPLILQRRINGTGVYDSLMDRLHKNGGAHVLMQVSQPEAILDWLASGLQAATLLPASEVKAVDPATCAVIPVRPDPQVYFPTIVKATETTLPADVASLLAQPVLPARWQSRSVP